MPADGGEAQLVAQGIEDMAWSADGSTAILDYHGVLERFFLSAGQPLPLSVDANHFALSPNGQLAALSTPGPPRQVLILDTSTGKKSSFPEMIVPAPASQPSDLAWSPDGRRLAVALGDDIVIADEHGERKTLAHGLNASGGDNANPVWSPDGTQIAFQHRGDNNAGLYAVEIGNGRTQRLTAAPPSPAVTSEPAWSPAGSAISFAVLAPGQTDVSEASLCIADSTRPAHDCLVGAVQPGSLVKRRIKYRN